MFQMSTSVSPPPQVASRSSAGENAKPECKYHSVRSFIKPHHVQLSVLQSLIVEARDLLVLLLIRSDSAPEARNLPSRENDTALGVFVCPSRTCNSLPVDESHS